MTFGLKCDIIIHSVMNSFFKPPKGKKSHIRRHVMEGGCSSIAGVEIANKGRQVNCHGTIITLPEKFTWILFRHGDKTNQSPTRGGKLTPLGRKQAWDTTWQLIEKFGQEAMDNAAFYTSPVHRVRQSANIIASAIGLDPAVTVEYISNLEWGPDNGYNNDWAAIELLIRADLSTRIKIAMGHNGLWENIAQIIYPRPGGYAIEPGEAFIITENGIEVISPHVTA